MVGRGLQKLHPALEIRYVWVESEGDRVTSGPLSAVGGKGLFTKAVEQVLLDGKADFAVHSMKDLPADELTAGLQIAAVPKRADVRDVVIGRSGPLASLDDLHQGASVGTSSPRRAAQLRQVRPDLLIELIRGNVGTRLSRVIEDGPGPDATLLAAAGLKRLGRGDLIGTPLEVDVMLPAACQGALGIQCRRDDHVSLTRSLPLNDPTTSTAIHAERSLVAGLGADCHSPIAVLAQQIDPAKTQAVRNADSHWFHLQAKVMAPDGSRVLAVEEKCKTSELRRLVKQMIDQLSNEGAREILKAAQGQALGSSPATAS